MGFTCLILIGYMFGITSKPLADNLMYVFVFYVINFIAVAIDLLLYVRNIRFERQHEAQGQSGMVV